jgi:hypothetical protein
VNKSKILYFVFINYVFKFISLNFIGKNTLILFSILLRTQSYLVCPRESLRGNIPVRVLYHQFSKGRPRTASMFQDYLYLLQSPTRKIIYIHFIYAICLYVCVYLRKMNHTYTHMIPSCIIYMS